jgi:NADH-quinone oxidoreductase subunit F
MIIAGWAVGAKNGYIYLREEYSHLRPLISNAITQCEQRGYLGENILGSGLNYKIHLYSGAGAYVCGEGSALSESIEGKAGRPRKKPPYIKQCGVFHLPTCVNNVESLSLVPNVMMDDDGFYKRQGTPECPGTKMISVSGNVNHPGVFEVPFGITIREIIDLAGGVTEGQTLRLVQLGGASGKIASPKQLDTPYTYNDLRKAGLTAVGSGAVLVVDERTSVIGFLRMTQEFFSHESCGQCTPCREGNRHITLFLEKLAAGEHTQKDVDTMIKFANIMCNASLCGLGESAQSALLSAVEHFPEEFQVKKEVAIR